MSFSYKFRTAAFAAVSVAVLSSLSGCATVREYWQRYTEDIDKSAREPTGYYEHAEVKKTSKGLVIPDGMVDPVSDTSLDIPDLPVNASDGPVGEEMDIRPPMAPLRSELGLQSQWTGGEAFIWFDVAGSHGVNDEASAWELLQKVLAKLNVAVGKTAPDAYDLTTVAADFNEFGSPYNVSDYGNSALRYRQIYHIRVGRGNDGRIGIATSLIGSMTMLASGYMMKDILDPIELQRFGMGFSNHIIHALEQSHNEKTQLPDVLTVTLEQDKNGQTCLAVDAPYDTTWKVVKQMLPKYHWDITEQSASKGSFKVNISDDSEDVYHEQGVDYFALDEDDYVVRLALEGRRTMITFFDEKDKALKDSLVERLYSGFSQALSKEFALYRSESIK